MSKFDGKVAFITGAAHGIGKQIAVQFAQEGANTVIVDFNKENGEATAKEISEKYVQSLFVQADVSNYDNMKQVREETFKAFGRVDILVLDAGIAQRAKVSEISMADRSGYRLSPSVIGHG
jgi:3-oxoacyl-[acyl-carrier protein] reductase